MSSDEVEEFFRSYFAAVAAWLGRSDPEALKKLQSEYGPGYFRLDAEGHRHSEAETVEELTAMGGLLPDITMEVTDFRMIASEGRLQVAECTLCTRFGGRALNSVVSSVLFGGERVWSQETWVV